MQSQAHTQLLNAGVVDALAFQKIHPKEFHRQFHEKKCRPDGRGLSHMRKLHVAPHAVKSSDGSCLVKLGRTTVVCALKLEVGTPYDTAPKDGRLVVSVNLSPLCSPNFHLGKASEKEISICEYVADVILGTKMITLSELCISERDSVWVVYADVVCLDYDGNVRDASLISVVNALKHLRLPDTKVADDGEVFVVPGDGGSSLHVRHHPIPTSIALVDDLLIADPTSEEEDLCRGTITVCYNEKDILCSVFKPGGISISDAQLKECLSLAKKRTKEVLTLMKV